MIKFLDFNKIFNPEDLPIYVPMHNKEARKRSERMTAITILKEAITDPYLEIGIALKNDMVVYHIHDEAEADTLLRIIKDTEVEAMVTRVPDGMDIYLKGKDFKRTNYNVLAIGAHADVYASSGKDFVISPFKHPSMSESDYLKECEIIYCTDKISAAPSWLLPIYKKSKSSPTSLIKFPLEDRYRDDALFKHFYRLNMLKFNNAEKELTLNLLNDYICETPVTMAMITKLTTKTVAKIPESEFFDEKSGRFYHNKMSEIVMEECYVKKDLKSNHLYHYNEQKKIYERNEEYLKGVMTRMAPTLKDTQKNEVIKYMTSYLELDKVQFNRDPFVITFKNGVLDLPTMTFSPHSPDNLETIILNVNYNPKAESTTADEFFDTATLSNKELETLLYEAIGYSLLKTSELAKSFILTGEGRNGKSTFLDLINEIVGDENATAIDLKSLANNFRISNLHGKLVSLAGDISNTPMNDTDLYKSLVSGDKIMIEKKFDQAFEDRVFATMFYSCNKLPRTPDTTYGFYRRFEILPFHADLSGVEEVDGMLFRRKLLGEASKEYVAYKAVQAIAKIFNTTKKFTRPKVCENIMNEYRIHNSSSLLWAYEEMKGKATTFVNKGTVTTYAKYKIWCETSGYKSQGMSRFQEEICAEFRLDIMPDTAGDNKFVKKV